MLSINLCVLVDALVLGKKRCSCIRKRELGCVIALSYFIVSLLMLSHGCNRDYANHANCCVSCFFFFHMLAKIFHDLDV